VILPPTSALEHSHYDLGLATLSVRNVAKYAPAVFERAADQRHDAEICIELWSRLSLPGGRLGALVGRALRPAVLKLGPEAIIDLALRAGKYRGLSLAKLRAHPHGLDLGALQPRLPDRLRTKPKRVSIAPKLYLDDLPRLRARMTAPSSDALILIGRRHLRSNNSWCHNSARLVKGKPRCTLLINPADAAARDIADGDTVELASKTGTIRVPAEISDEIMAGVVSLPHGWGHDRAGTQLSVASASPGVSANDVTSETLYDPLSGNAALSGLPVVVTRTC
jgi:anaerobic selenocysteine-containing dehydrogenase